MNIEDKLYWGRAAGGSVLGLVMTILEVERFGSVTVILLAVAAYVVSALLLRLLLVEEQRAALGRKLYLTGSGAYGALFLLTWILSYNLIQHV